MERRDVLIVVVGALLVAGATAFVAARGSAQFALTYTSSRDALAPSPSTASDSTGTTTFTAPFDVSGENVSAVTARIVVSAAAFAPTASIHATLRAPDGNESVSDVSPSGGSTVTFTIERAVARTPSNGTIAAASLDDATRQLAASSHAGSGAWVLTVRVSSGAPLPVAPTTSIEAFASRWSGRAAPAPPAASR